MSNFLFFILGNFTGIFLLSILVAGSRADEDIEKINKEKEIKNG